MKYTLFFLLFFSLIHTYGQITEEGIISTGDAGGNHAFTGTHSNATFDNWMNTGYSGTAYNLLGYSNPHAGFGIVDGNNIVSPIIWMYAHTRNAFIVKTMNYLGDMTSGADLFTVRANGNVGIGTTNPQSKLAVKGQIRATEVKVLANISVPDYVFEQGHNNTPVLNHYYEEGFFPPIISLIASLKLVKNTSSPYFLA